MSAESSNDKREFAAKVTASIITLCRVLLNTKYFWLYTRKGHICRLDRDVKYSGGKASDYYGLAIDKVLT